MTEVRSSFHGTRRLRARAGLSKKAAQRMAEKAMEHGISRETAKGAVRLYLHKMFAKGGHEGDFRIYGNTLFIFKNRVLVTSWEVPGYLRSAVAAQSGKGQR